MAPGRFRIKSLATGSESVESGPWSSGSLSSSDEERSGSGWGMEHWSWVVPRQASFSSSLSRSFLGLFVKSWLRKLGTQKSCALKSKHWRRHSMCVFVVSTSGHISLVVIIIRWNKLMILEFTARGSAPRLWGWIGIVLLRQCSM